MFWSQMIWIWNLLWVTLVNCLPCRGWANQSKMFPSGSVWNRNAFKRESLLLHWLTLLCLYVIHPLILSSLSSIPLLVFPKALEHEYLHIARGHLRHRTGIGWIKIFKSIGIIQANNKQELWFAYDLETVRTIFLKTWMYPSQLS